MPADPRHVESLIRMRDAILDEMEEADQEFTRVRLRVERMESDLRIGRGEHPDYAQVKGHDLPQAEQRMVDLFRQLLKMEDKINLGSP
jgi:hypothetical protein